MKINCKTKMWMESILILFCLVIVFLTEVFIPTNHILILAEAAGSDRNTYSEDFSGYQTGSDGSPNWVTEDLHWKITDKHFISNSTVQK